MDYLHQWRLRKNKKPLIIRGARQVGKTWLMREFGKIAYEKIVYVSFDNGADVIPVEVKSEVNLQAKSLKTYHEKFQPRKSIRVCMADYKDEGWLLNLPLWAIETIA
jgi:predicted AAA+ superfamily ATPase